VEVTRAAGQGQVHPSAFEQGHTDRITCALKPTAAAKPHSRCASKPDTEIFTVGSSSDSPPSQGPALRGWPYLNGGVADFVFRDERAGQAPEP